MVTSLSRPVARRRRKDPASGVEFLLAELGAGQMFGEMALLTGRPRPATVIAIEPTTCAVLGRVEFEQALQPHPDIALAFTRLLAERLERANEQAGVGFVNLSRLKIDPRVPTLLPQPVVNEHGVLPIAFCNNRLTLAMTNPNNVVAFDDVRRILKGVMIEPVVVTEEDFRRFVSSAYAAVMNKPEQAAPSARGKDAARADNTADAIHEAAVRAGMVDLKRYSALLLTEGLTTVEEVTSVESVRD